MSHERHALLIECIYLVLRYRGRNKQKMKDLLHPFPFRKLAFLLRLGHGVTYQLKKQSSEERESLAHVGWSGDRIGWIQGGAKLVHFVHATTTALSTEPLGRSKKYL